MSTSPEDVFLRGVWRRMQGCGHDALTGSLADELRRQGASDGAIEQFVKAALARLAWDLAYFLDMPTGSYWGSPPHTDVADGDPSWQLAEVRPDGSVSGEVVAGLHEMFLEADPSGREGADWGY